jgi:hypothetical protein
MTSEEEKQVLQMVENGRLSAEEGIRLLKALGESAGGQAVEIVEPEASYSSEPFDSAQGFAYDSESRDAEIRRFTAIPLWIGMGFILLGALLMYWTMQSTGFGFWFYFAWLPFLLGVGLIALAAGARASRWLFVRVQGSESTESGRIVFGFPLPLRQAAWLLRHFGHWFQRPEYPSVEDILSALDQVGTLDSPVVINTQDDGQGERVQVFTSTCTSYWMNSRRLL